MADNCDRFGPHRSSEDLENDRNKMLEKEKLSTKTIQRRTNAVWNMKRRGQTGPDPKKFKQFSKLIPTSLGTYL